MKTKNHPSSAIPPSTPPNSLAEQAGPTKLIFSRENSKAASSPRFLESIASFFQSIADKFSEAAAWFGRTEVASWFRQLFSANSPASSPLISIRTPRQGGDEQHPLPLSTEAASAQVQSMPAPTTKPISPPLAFDEAKFFVHQIEIDEAVAAVEGKPFALSSEKKEMLKEVGELLQTAASQQPTAQPGTVQAWEQAMQKREAESLAQLAGALLRPDRDAFGQFRVLMAWEKGGCKALPKGDKYDFNFDAAEANARVLKRLLGKAKAADHDPKIEEYRSEIENFFRQAPRLRMLVNLEESKLGNESSVQIQTTVQRNANSAESNGERRAMEAAFRKQWGPLTTDDEAVLSQMPDALLREQMKSPRPVKPDMIEKLDPYDPDEEDPDLADGDNDQQDGRSFLHRFQQGVQGFADLFRPASEDKLSTVDPQHVENQAALGRLLSQESPGVTIMKAEAAAEKRVDAGDSSSVMTNRNFNGEMTNIPLEMDMGPAPKPPAPRKPVNPAVNATAESAQISSSAARPGVASLPHFPERISIPVLSKALYGDVTKAPQNLPLVYEAAMRYFASLGSPTINPVDKANALALANSWENAKKDSGKLSQMRTLPEFSTLDQLLNVKEIGRDFRSA